MPILDGQVAIVTGASRGIGKAAAIELAACGALVVVNYRSRSEDAGQVVESIRQNGGRAEACAGDVSSETDVRGLVQFALRKFGGVDILVSNAGVTRDLLLGSMKLEDWESVMTINVRGAFLTVREVLPHMMSKRSGCIILLSSIAAEHGGRGHANYAASKGAINAMTKSLAIEFAPRNIRVNAVAPGVILTDMTTRIRTFAEDEIKTMIPLKRMGEAAEVARAIRFLASPDASYITGQVLNVAGGLGL
ncbi:MAG TPA: 3-oxoacyl-ACP reductase family protein [Bryobacteraceae bacterium]|nr:3-oxoacyl-ACP reductase family protein [Bryobacteraceae bacterium]